MKAADFESGESAHENASSTKHAAASAPGHLNEHGGPPESEGVGQVSAVPCPVEDALAKALSAATAAGQWQVVGQLASELQARREAREAKAATEGAKVIPLGRGRQNVGRP